MPSTGHPSVPVYLPGKVAHPGQQGAKPIRGSLGHAPSPLHVPARAAVQHALPARRLPKQQLVVAAVAEQHRLVRAPPEVRDERRVALARAHQLVAVARLVDVDERVVARHPEVRPARGPEE
eukprot:268770-Prorocentrum_minimum.AAC.1